MTKLAKSSYTSRAKSFTAPRSHQLVALRPEPAQKLHRRFRICIAVDCSAAAASFARASSRGNVDSLPVRKLHRSGPSRSVSCQKFSKYLHTGSPGGATRQQLSHQGNEALSRRRVAKERASSSRPSPEEE